MGPGEEGGTRGGKRGGPVRAENGRKSAIKSILMAIEWEQTGKGGGDKTVEGTAPMAAALEHIGKRSKGR